MDDSYEDLGFQHLDALAERRHRGAAVARRLDGVDLALWTRLVVLAAAVAAAASIAAR